MLPITIFDCLIVRYHNEEIQQTYCLAVTGRLHERTQYFNVQQFEKKTIISDIYTAHY